MTGFRDQIVGGTRLIRNDIHSPNFVTGVSGWIIRKDGTAEFSDAVIRGEIWVGVAPDGQIHVYTAAGVGVIDFWTNDVAEVAPGQLLAEAWSGGGSDFLNVLLTGPTDVAGDAPWLRLGRNKTGGYTFLDTDSYLVQMVTTQGLVVLCGAAAQPAFRMATTADANYRIIMYGNGNLLWGDGTNPPDVMLSRLAAGNLQVTGDFTVTGHTLNVAGIYPRLRAGTTMSTATTATFTAETVTDTVTVYCINGKDYCLEFRGGWRSTVAGDIVGSRIREDNIAGTTIQENRTRVSASGSVNHDHLYAQYTHAAATGWKTFVTTGFRSAGTGNISRCAGATFPSYFYVDQIS